MQWIDNIYVLGLQGSVDYKDIKFPSYSQFDSIDLLSEKPRADIFICHSAPYGIHDDRNDSSHIGLMGITQYIKRHQPRYCLHGHMHQQAKTVFNNTTVISVYDAIVLNYENGEYTNV